MRRITPIAGLLALLMVGCQPSLQRYEYTQRQMGTAFRMVLYAPDQAAADQAAAAAFARVGELNDVCSDYLPDSELSRLCAQTRPQAMAAPVAVSEDLWRVLVAAQAMSKRTHGAFDVTVGPYVRLWRRARRQGELPSLKRLAEARAASGYQFLELHSTGTDGHAARRVRLRAANMRLDLGGIAKGYATDEALRVLRARGIDRALVDGGGDVAVSDAPPGRPGWRIAVRALTAQDQPSGQYVWLTNAAIATSGDMFRYIEIDDVRYSHIIDPRTGLGLTERVGVSVIAKDGMTADALASAVSVLGEDRGIALVEATPGAAARATVMHNDIPIINQSSRWAQWVDHEAADAGDGE